MRWAKATACGTATSSLSRRCRRPKATSRPPWIDGDGDGLPYPQDAITGTGRNLGLGRPSGFAGQAQFIEPPTMPQPAGTQPVQIAVQILDEHRPSTSVWMMVTKPSTPPALTAAWVYHAGKPRPTGKPGLQPGK